VFFYLASLETNKRNGGKMKDRDTADLEKLIKEAIEARKKADSFGSPHIFLHQNCIVHFTWT
jgi:hypothetical protein